MRRYWVVALALLALLGVLSPPAWAQAPKVTINGIVDMMTTMSHNLRDANFARVGDKEWYARTRFRPDITAAVGSAKAVLGLEIDTIFGQASGADTNTCTGFGPVTGITPTTVLPACGTTQRAGATSGFDLNTDTQGSIEVKWAYLQFPLPLVPWATIFTVGAQPFGALATYKLAALANGDFAGFSLVTTWTPTLKSLITFVNIEEELTGGSTGGTGATQFTRGDDFALILAADVIPMKELTLRPVYSVLWAQGATSGSARQIPGTILGATAFARKPVGGSCVAATGVGCVPTHEEWRHTIGVDARWRSGPWYFDPTFLYQWGTRDTDNLFVGATTAGSGSSGIITKADISAWFIDLAGGWRSGPLLLEARYLYTTGNRPKDQLNRDVNYYQVISADTSYWADNRWGNIYALGIDYFNGAILGMGANISINRYGRQQFGVKGTYSWTPAVDVYTMVSPAWTARSVDTDANPFAATNCATHSANSALNPSGAGCDGDASFMGTEWDLGLQWRFAPGLAFDLVGAVLFAGSALDITERRNGILTKRDSEDVYTAVARVRFAF